MKFSWVHGILQARILEWVAIPVSRGFSQRRSGTQVSCIAGGFFTRWATGEAPKTGSNIEISNIKIKTKTRSPANQGALI